MSLVQLLTTVASREAATELAREAVEAGVAACVQVLGPLVSVYRWRGSLEETEEFLCLMKTPEEALERLVAFVRDRHGYETPELTALRSMYVDDAYLQWARTETATDPEPG